MALLWAVVFSVIATAVLQEMAARVELVTRKGLSEAIRESFSEPVVRFLSLGLVAVAIALGNAAYETGNLLGASLGLESLSGVSRKPWVFVIAAAASGLLMSGTYRVIQRVLVGLVVLMSFVFLVTAILVKPSVAELAHGFDPIGARRLPPHDPRAHRNHGRAVQPVSSRERGAGEMAR